MKTHLSEEQISEWIAGQQGREVTAHLKACPDCEAEVQRTRNALYLFRDSGHQAAAYWQAQTESRKRSRSAGWAAAAVVALALILAVSLHRPPVPSATVPGQEVFTQIPYVIPPAPYERTQVVRMDVPVAALIAAGLRMETAAAASSVSADVMIGQDGRALAVSLVPDSSTVNQKER